jgi:hypothetical protein
MGSGSSETSKKAEREVATSRSCSSGGAASSNCAKRGGAGQGIVTVGAVEGGDALAGEQGEADGLRQHQRQDEQCGEPAGQAFGPQPERGSSCSVTVAAKV